LRIGLLVAFFALGIIFPYNEFRIDELADAVPVGIPVLVIGMCILAILFPPLALIFVIGIQAFNPFSAPLWTKPSWRSNFLNLRDPLHFFHFGAFAVLAGAAGSALGNRRSILLSYGRKTLYNRGLYPAPKTQNSVTTTLTTTAGRVIL